MRFCAFALVAGMAALHCLPQLPHPAAYPVGVLLILVSLRPRHTRVLGFFIAGFLWAMWRADLVLAQRLAPADAGRVATLSGRVVESPTDFGVGIRFPIVVSELRDLTSRALPPRHVLVNWYGVAQAPAAGALCVVKVRLSEPHGARNPGSFDREKWLFRRRFGATASVIAHPANACVATPGSATERLRKLIRERLARRADTVAAGGVIAALTIADRSGLSDASWRILRDTGTAHLLAISGLHISLVAGATFIAVRVLIGLFAPVGRRWPAQRPAALAAILVASAYAALAGFPVSAERALVMLAVAMLAVVARRPAVTVDNYALAMAFVAVADPLALLGMGFWLSFTAVGCLLLIDLTRQRGGTLRRVARLHLALALGMTPLLGVLYESIPLASPIANLVAVPVVTFAIVPCALAGAALAPLTAAGADLLWDVGLFVWSLLWAWLCWLESVLPALALPAAPSPAAIVLAVAGVLIAFVPIVPWARASGAALCTALLIPPAPDLVAGELR
ncbi:MAG: ComEC/Rec2 family competence protein, partial [Gammaproteobacteria bacterium]